MPDMRHLMDLSTQPELKVGGWISRHNYDVKIAAVYSPTRFVIFDDYMGQAPGGYIACVMAPEDESYFAASEDDSRQPSIEAAIQHYRYNVVDDGQVTHQGVTWQQAVEAAREAAEGHVMNLSEPGGEDALDIEGDALGGIHEDMPVPEGTTVHIRDNVIAILPAD